MWRCPGCMQLCQRAGHEQNLLRAAGNVPAWLPWWSLTPGSSPSLHPHPCSPLCADGRCTRTTGLSSKDHVNIQNILPVPEAQRSPSRHRAPCRAAQPGTGTTCSINAAHVQQIRIKSGLLKAPSQLHPILSLIYLPRVMLSAQDSHPDSYPSRGNIANANSCFLLLRSGAVTEQPHTRDVKP